VTLPPAQMKRLSKKEGAVCPIPQYILPPRETLQKLDSFGYDYQYVGQGLYRVRKFKSEIRQYLNTKEITEMVETLTKQRERKIKREEKANAATTSPTSKRFRLSTGLRRGKSKGKGRATSKGK
jgi:Tfp pilus assembly ATPase PilU